MKVVSLICIVTGFLASVVFINYACAVVYGGWFIFLTAPVCVCAGIYLYEYWITT